MARSYGHNLCCVIGMLILVAGTCVAQEYYLDTIAETVNEGNGPLRITIRRTFDTGDGDVRLRMSHNNVASPASADDYDSSDINVQFIGTAVTEYAFLPIREDDTYEEDEMFTVTLTVIDGTVGTARSSADVLTVTIEDNDSLYYIDEEESDLSVREDTSKAVITIKRMGFTEIAGSVLFSTDDTSSAKDGLDYTAITNEEVQFLANMLERTVSVVIEDDKDGELAGEQSEETFEVYLSSPENGQLGTPSRSTMTIINDDGVYSLEQATYTIGESQDAIEICVERTEENTLKQRIVEISALNDGTVTNTATPDGDYIPLTSVTGRLVFGVGDNRECVDITILPDEIVESSETFSLVLSEVPGETGIPNAATVYITDDDVTFSFRISTTTVYEGIGYLSVDVVRNGASPNGATLSIGITSTPVTASSPTDYTDVYESTITFPPGITSSTETFQVVITNDFIYEPSELFYLELVQPSVGTLVSPRRMTITIVDDDPLPPVITENPPPPAPVQPADLSNGTLIGIIIGSVAGFLLLIIFLLCCCWAMGMCDRQPKQQFGPAPFQTLRAGPGPIPQPGPQQQMVLVY